MKSGRITTSKLVSGLLAIAVLIGGASVLGVWRVHRRRAEDGEFARLQTITSTSVDSETESAIVAFCSDCHALPRPESFPRNAWHREVEYGYEFYAKSGRTDLKPPSMSATVAYYRSRAPERFVFPEPVEAKSLLRATFRTEKLPVDNRLGMPPAVAYLVWSQLKPEDQPVLVSCDMRNGQVESLDLQQRERRPRPLARLNNPCHIEPCDLDRDGRTDLIIADLGTYIPDDHDLGRVVWLRRSDTQSEFEEVVLASGLGRVADAQVSDLDSDGDLDLIVADFGLFRTGGIVMLENVAIGDERPRFRTKCLDTRPGPIHVPILDIDTDGRMDFLALVSQQYESVDAFLCQDDGRFQRHSLWSAPDLAFGSSGIEPVDLDQDGDTDILYTNGDSFDNSYANPYHGVQWLENLGDVRFAYHRLADLTGAYRALPGDIDLDGDLDIVAVAWLPPNVKPASLSTESLPSILCLEQTSPGVFARHTLVSGVPFHVALELADFDADGDLDFAVGAHILQAGQTTHRLAIWWNQIN